METSGEREPEATTVRGFNSATVSTDISVPHCHHRISSHYSPARNYLPFALFVLVIDNTAAPSCVIILLTVLPAFISPICAALLGILGRRHRPRFAFTSVIGDKGICLTAVPSSTRGTITDCLISNESLLPSLSYRSRTRFSSRRFGSVKTPFVHCVAKHTCIPMCGI